MTRDGVDHAGDDGATICDLFAACVRRFPEHRAVTCQGTTLTYAQLDRRVDALARSLVRAGVAVGEPVALQLAPSLDTVIAMLGVLRAGATYLPIDADLPDDRVRYLLDDSGARIRITGVDAITDPSAAHVALPQVGVCDGAYLIYTSGTTGTPKGVLVEHRSVVNYVTWFGERYAVGPTHTAALLTSYAFDLGYTTLWTTLLSGGHVHVLPRSLCEDLGAVARYLREHRVTFIKVTPSLLGALLAARDFDRDACASLRLVVTGGERVRPRDIELLYARSPDVLVVNHYGPTETTIGVATHPIERAQLAAFAERPVIGKPIGNARFYVATPELELVPIGEPGELLVGGRCVARGYHGRDDLTRERFVPDPFGGAGTLYRTGDLARWTPDGTIEFLGRIDRQLKVRGYRIEPSEIEQVMVRRLGMTEVVVIDRELGANHVLCAYHVGGAGLAAAELRASLAQVLPDYMVPAYFVEVAALPRTANGKLDVARLPEPRLAVADPPRTETERVLQTMWSAILGVAAETIGTSQSFFELGGHSLLMIQLIAEIDDHFGKPVSVAAFYQDGTIRALARLLDAPGGDA